MWESKLTLLERHVWKTKFSKRCIFKGSKQIIRCHGRIFQLNKNKLKLHAWYMIHKWENHEDKDRKLSFFNEDLIRFWTTAIKLKTRMAINFAPVFRQYNHRLCLYKYTSLSYFNVITSIISIYFSSELNALIFGVKIIITLFCSMWIFSPIERLEIFHLFSGFDFSR